MKLYPKIISEGTIWDNQDNIFGYAAWPTAAIAANGDLLVVCSGYRTMHVCPFGKVLLFRSRDGGQSWSSPTILIDTPLDDRDAGIVHAGGGRLYLSTFTLGRAVLQRKMDQGTYGPAELCSLANSYIRLLSDEQEEKYLGSLMAESNDDGFSWSKPYRIPISAPHGPSLARDGSLLMAGTPYPKAGQESVITVYKSGDGHTWEPLGRIPEYAGETKLAFSEPHILQLDSGRLLVHIRADEPGKPYENKVFTVFQSISDDNGATWTAPVRINADGAPPHLLGHSSGVVVCAYGRRKPPYGIQVILSGDGGESWDEAHYLWAGGDHPDLGYPALVELPGGDIFTVFYAKRGNRKAAVLWLRWRFVVQ